MVVPLRRQPESGHALAVPIWAKRFLVYANCLQNKLFVGLVRNPLKPLIPDEEKPAYSKKAQIFWRGLTSLRPKGG